MASITIHAGGAAVPDDAWERYAVPARWPDWAPQLARVRSAARRIAPGVTGSVYGPGGVRLDFEIDSVDEAARRWSWHVWRGPLRLRLQHGVRAHGSGSRTWLTVEGPLPVVIGYAPIARLALGRLVAR